jgi:hypothetical protein
MRRILVMSVLTALFVGLLAGPASARNVNQAQLERAGWDCALVGDEPHCVPPNAGLVERIVRSDAAIPVMVFSGEGDFRGTELLLREDLYAGQPCPRDMVLELPFGYVACHHYPQ